MPRHSLQRTQESATKRSLGQNVSRAEVEKSCLIDRGPPRCYTENQILGAAPNAARPAAGTQCRAGPELVRFATGETREVEGPESQRRVEPSHFRGHRELVPASPSVRCVPRRAPCRFLHNFLALVTVLQGTWGGLWLHAQGPNSISTCLSGICCTKLEINNSFHRMNNSTEGTKGCWQWLASQKQTVLPSKESRKRKF